MALTDDLVFSCPMNESFGESLFDRSGNNYHLVPFTKSIPPIDVGSGEYWRECGIGGASENRHVRLMNRAMLAMSGLTTGRAAGWRTVGAWTFALQFKRIITTGTHSLFGIWTTPNKSFLCRILTDDTVCFYWSTDGTNEDTTDPAVHETIVDDTNVHTLIVKWDGTDITLNLDGTRNTFTPAGPYFSWADSTYMSLFGVGGLLNFFDAYVRNATLWLRAIDTAEEAAFIADPTIAQTSPKRAGVWFLIGQSNGDQQGTASEITEGNYYTYNGLHYLANPHVSTYLPACWGLAAPCSGDKFFQGVFGAELSFMKTIGDRDPFRDIAIVQAAVGSTRLKPTSGEWWAGDVDNPAGSTYLQAITQLDRAMRELAAGGITAELEGTIWVHGETDASEGDSALYYGWCLDFIDSLRAFYVDRGYTTNAKTPFIIPKLSVAQDASDAITMAEILAQQAVVSSIVVDRPCCYSVETDDLSIIVGSSLHYNSASLVTLGERMAANVAAQTADEFQTNLPGMESPGSNFFAVTPNDSADLANITNAIWIGTGGDLVIDGAESGTCVTLSNLTAGLYFFRCSRIYATGTTADNIVGIY